MYEQNRRKNHIFKYYEGLSDLKDPNTECRFFSPILNPENDSMYMIQLFYYIPPPSGYVINGQNKKSYGLTYLFYNISNEEPRFKKSISCDFLFDDFNDLDAVRFWEK